MGIRELAAEAKKADEAAAKAEKKRLWHLNARLAEQAVLELLGVPAKTTRTRDDKEMRWGAGSIVRLEDDLYVRIKTVTQYGPAPYGYGARPITSEKVGFMLTDDQGTARPGHYDPFFSLGGLSDALEATEAYEAAKAARLAKEMAEWEARAKA